MATVLYEKEGFEVTLDDTDYLLYVYAEAEYNYTPPDKEDLEITHVEVSDVADMDSGAEVHDNATINRIKELAKAKLYKMDLLNWSGQDPYDWDDL